MAEQRLIDANALIDWLTRATGFRTNCDDCTDIDCLDCIIEEAIKNAPTVEAKPVVHAHWVSKDTMEKFPYAKNHYCSNCKVDVIECGNFCTNCGAQMDEKRMKQNE